MAHIQCGCSKLHRETVGFNGTEDNCNPVFEKIRDDDVIDGFNDEGVKFLIPATENDDQIREEMIRLEFDDFLLITIIQTCETFRCKSWLAPHKSKGLIVIKLF